MAYRLKFSGRAVREIGEVHDWYEESSPGLGSEFQLAFELQMKRVEQVPLMFPELLPGIRRTLLPRFPYGVFYTVRLELVHTASKRLRTAISFCSRPIQITRRCISRSLEMVNFIAPELVSTTAHWFWIGTHGDDDKLIG